MSVALFVAIALALIAQLVRPGSTDVRHGDVTSGWDFVGRGLVDPVNTAQVYNSEARGEVILLNPGKKHPRFARIARF